MTEEQKNIIENNRGETAKNVCITLNELRREIDGTYVNNCFCSLSSRRIFLKEFYVWFDKQITSQNF